MVTLETLEQTNCPVRTQYGCILCPYYKQPSDCYGRKLLDAEAQIAALQAQIKAGKTALAAGKRLVHNRERALRRAEEQVRLRESALKADSAGLDTEVTRAKALTQPDASTKKIAAEVVKQNKPRRKNGTYEQSSICGDCRVCNCSWMHHLAPVDGWTAIPSAIYKDGWVITHCPKFQKVEERPRSNAMVTEEQFREMNGIKRRKKSNP